MASPGTSSSLSSPLSSVASRSPTPPVDYPSPLSSHDSENGRPLRVREEPEDAQNHDEAPAKRRKTAAPKELKQLKTEYLDLSALNESDDATHHKSQDAKLKRLMETLRSKKKIVVIAGAGISVTAGIPDFRSSTGLFTTLRSQHKLKSSGKHLFDASVYRSDSSTSSFHDMVRQLSYLTQKATPTPFHHMLATLAEEGRLMRLYTQNIDGIETSIPPLATQVPLHPKGPWPKTIQLHGGLEKMVCTKCSKLSDFDGTLFEGPEAPSCGWCEEKEVARTAAGLRGHGIGRLRPRMVLYNEFNPDADAIGAVSHADIKKRPDAVIVVGTSLKVPGTRLLAREMCAVVRDRKDGFTAWINVDPEPVGTDLNWDMVVRGECDDVARHVGLPYWDDKDCGEYQVVKDEKLENKGLVGVVLESSPPPFVLKDRGILTPTDSPRHQSPTPLTNMTKMKQPQISFAPKPVALTKAGKPKKKPGRKPLPNGKVKNSITNSFTATKTSKTPVGKTLKKIPGLDISSSSLPLPNTPMHPISPLDSRSNSDATTKALKVSVEIPPYDRQETISPKGAIPSGMANLLS